MSAKYKGSAARKEPDKISDPAVRGIERLLELCKSYDLKPETMVTESQLILLRDTNRIMDTPDNDETKPLGQIVGNLIKTYEHSSGNRFPYKILRRYGWRRYHFDVSGPPELRIVPKNDEKPWDEYEPGGFNEKQAADVQVEDLADLVSKGRVTKDIAQYLKEISRYPVLTHEEVIELSRRIRQGDIQAAKELARHNLKFVVSIAKRYQGRGLSLMDLIQAGSLGLLRAVEKFEADRGIRFSTYAGWWIKQAVRKEIIEHRRDVRIPQYLVEEISKVNKLNRLYAETHNRLPSPDEIQEELGLKPGHVKLVLKAMAIDFVYVDHLSFGLREEPAQLIDKKADSFQDSVQFGEEYSKAQRLLEASLSERERLIMEQRRQGKSLDVVGRMIDLTRERVRQIEAFAKVKLNHALGIGPSPSDVKAEMNERMREYKRRKREAKKK